MAQIEKENQVLLVSTVLNRMAPRIPQMALNKAANVLKMAPDRTIHCFKSALALLQQHPKAHPKKILTNGTMNKTKIVTLIQVTTSAFHASEVGHKLDVKAQIDHGMTRHKASMPKTSDIQAKHLLFSP